MSRLVKRHWIYFQLILSETSLKQKQNLISIISNDQLRALTQIVDNFLRQTLTLSPAAIDGLRRYRTLFRRLADRRITLKHKRKIVKGRAKAITELLKVVEPALKTYLK